MQIYGINLGQKPTIQASNSLEIPKIFRLETNNLKSLPENLCSELLRPEKIHRTQPFRINLPLFSTVLPSNSSLFLSCHNLLLDGRMVENKDKLILTEIFPSVQKHDI